ncbi:unnamed protein product [Prorocentrum cordatum]|uniref:RNA-directed RNA polymerase n=1 Tax=Prorocentrum cordatum TaxID=2364126 RepID=A0ABN9XHB8_9DINO|nr:unnamed protein product [Polarella glacialis]
MALSPTVGRLRTMTSISEVVAFTSLSNDACVAVAVGTGGLGTNPRDIAILPPLAAQAGLAWRIARKLSYVAGGGDPDSFVDVDPLVEVSATAAAAPPAPPGGPMPSAWGPLATIAKKVKISAVADQADDAEIAGADAEDVGRWHQHYITVMGAPPMEEEEPSTDQLQVLHHRVYVAKAAPYVDHAMFGPRGRQTARANKFRTWIPTAGGYISRELPGPENFQQWQASWRVFVVAAIMLDFASQAALAQCEKNIEQLTRLWPSAWHLIVAADDECRADHLERTRGVLKRLRAQNEPAPADCSEQRPWPPCFRTVAVDAAFWDKQVRHPAAAWVAAGSRGVPLAPAEQVVQDHIPGGVAAITTPQEQPAGRKKRKGKRQRQAPEDRPPPKAPRQGDADHGGTKSKGSGKSKLHRTDGYGKEICYAWNNQRGACANVAAGQPRPAGRVHACQKCLSKEHSMGQTGAAIAGLLKDAGEKLRNGDAASVASRPPGAMPREPGSMVAQEVADRPASLRVEPTAAHLPRPSCPQSGAILRGPRLDSRAADEERGQPARADSVAPLVSEVHAMRRVGRFGNALVRDVPELQWKGAEDTKHGTFMAQSAKQQWDAESSRCIGGMRNPARAVAMVLGLRRVGQDIAEAFKHFYEAHAGASALAWEIGDKECKGPEQDLIVAWRAQLRNLPGARGRGRLAERGGHAPPLVDDIWDAWLARAGDPEDCLGRRAREGVLLGIEKRIEAKGAFPAMDDELRPYGAPPVEEASLSGFRNYASLYDRRDGAKEEVERYLEEGNGIEVDWSEAANAHPDGSISKMALIVREKPDGSIKKRIIVDPRRPGANGKSLCPERIVLPRVDEVVQDAAALAAAEPSAWQEAAARGEDMSTWGVEFLSADFSDAYMHLMVHPEERKHCYAKHYKEGKLLLWVFLCFGHKAAPLLRGRLAAACARVLQGLAPEGEFRSQPYLDDPLWLVMGTRATRERTIAHPPRAWLASLVA